MTFDLFDTEPAAAPTPAPALPTRSAPDPERLAYPLTPAGEPNRWTYRGEVVMYDTSTLAVPGRGRWSSLEGIGKPLVRGESHVDICKAIDARLALGEPNAAPCHADVLLQLANEESETP